MALKAGEISDMFKLFARSMVIGNAVNTALSRKARLDPINANDHGAEDRIISTAMQATFKIFAGKSKNILASFLEAERVFEGREGDILGAMIKEENQVDEEAELNEMANRLKKGIIPAVRKEFIASNGYRVTPVPDTKDLARIGRYMDHCAGGSHHSEMAMKGSEHFFQVSHPDAPKNPYYEGTLMIPEISPGCTIRYDQFFTFDNGQVIAKNTANGRSSKMKPPEELKFIDKANGIASGALVSEQCWKAWEEWRDSFTPEMITSACRDLRVWQDFYSQQKANQINLTAKENARMWEPVTGYGMSDPEMFQKTWEAWQDVMRKADKGFVADSSEVLFRNEEARDVVGMISSVGANILRREADERRREAEARRALEAQAPAP